MTTQVHALTRSFAAAHPMTCRNAELALGGLVVLGEWTGLARGVVRAPVLSGLLDVGLLAILVWAAMTRSRTRLHPLDALVGLYVALALAEMFNPNVPGIQVALEGFRKTAFTAVAYGVARLSTPSIIRMSAIVASGSCIAFAYAIRQFFLPLSVDRAIVATSGVSASTFNQAGQLRAFAPTAGPFHLGVIAAACLVMALVLGATRGRAWFVAALMAAGALALTLTRANWAAAAAGTAVAAALLGVSHSIARRTLLLGAGVAAIGVAGAIVVAFAAFPASGGRLESFLTSIVDPLGARNLQLRFDYWEAFVSAIRANPFTGYGTSAAADGFKPVYDAAGSAYFQPHSIYFKAILEMGILGLLALVSVLVVALASAFRARTFDAATASIAAGTVTIVIVAGLTGPMLDAYPFNVLFWATLGALVSVALTPTARTGESNDFAT